jgi:response regulator RpfG family c-di-GMP phosphodiesterase
MQKKLKVVHLDPYKFFKKAFEEIIDPEKKKYCIEKFEKSDDALRFIENSFVENTDIDLILTELNTLGTNGYDFCKEVRNLESKYNKKITIILFTMFYTDSSNLIEQGLHEKYFDIYLHKTAEVYEVIAAMDSLLKN